MIRWDFVKKLDPLAVYGAGLATVLAIMQISAYRKDRASVTLKVRRNMTDTNPGSNTPPFILVTATNVGRRPVTITGFAAKLLYPNEHTDWYLADIRPRLPHEITEGQFVTAYLNQATANISSVEQWYVWDSTGRHFRLNEAPWTKRWASTLQKWVAGTKP